jgi:hypothetical protein
MADCLICETEHSLTVPIVHLNGTSPESLSAGYEAAYDAVQQAIRMLADSAPNGRDYYMYPGDALSVATNEHFARMQKLQDVAKELDELIGHVETTKRLRDDANRRRS